MKVIAQQMIARPGAVCYLQINQDSDSENIYKLLNRQMASSERNVFLLILGSVTRTLVQST